MRAIQESFVPIIELRSGQSKVEVGSTLPVSDSGSAANLKQQNYLILYILKGKYCISGAFTYVCLISSRRAVYAMRAVRKKNRRPEGDDENVKDASDANAGFEAKMN